MNALVQCKAAVRRVIPAEIYERGSIYYRRALNLAKDPLFAGRFGFPKAVIYFGTAPGDDLLCTVVLREMRKRGQKRIWMMSNHPQLFSGNRDAAKVVPVEDRFRDYAMLWGARYQPLEYAGYDPQLDRGQPTTGHVITELCIRAGVTGKIEIRPYFYPTDAEKEKAAWAKGMIIIQSSGLAAKWPMRNKEWYPERFQEVINRRKKDFKFAQIGSATDPLLNEAMDLRGKTSIRESAAILSQARLFVGLEGFVMHLARSVECPAVIVFGGRTAPGQFGYGCNINLYSAVPCAPCWFWNRCDYNRMCMENIAAPQVVNAIEEMMARSRSPLLVDSVTISKAESGN